MNATPAACRRCGRTLRSASSIAAAGGPIGRTCARRDREDQAAAAAAIKPTTRAKAEEILELGAIARTAYRTTAGNAVFEVVASDGVGRYFASRTGCTCKAALRGHVCAHRAAVLIAAA